MKLSDAEVRELFQRKTARSESRTADCLDEQTLIRAAAGELGAAERERVSGHIARCSDCAREFRIVRELAPLEEAARREYPEPRRAASWMAIAATVLLAVALPALLWSIATIRQLRGEVAELRDRPPVVRTTTVAVTDPKAAEDVAALRTTVAELSRPQLDVPIVDLDADVVRGAGNALPTISVPPSADAAALILHLPDETSAPLEIEIVDRRGRVVTTEHVSAREGRSRITLVLRRKILSQGEHVIRVRSRGRTTTFHFRVDYL